MMLTDLVAFLVRVENEGMGCEIDGHNKERMEAGPHQGDLGCLIGDQIRTYLLFSCSLSSCLLHLIQPQFSLLFG